MMLTRLGQPKGAVGILSVVATLVLGAWAGLVMTIAAMISIEGNVGNTILVGPRYLFALVFGVAYIWFFLFNNQDARPNFFESTSVELVASLAVLLAGPHGALVLAVFAGALAWFEFIGERRPLWDALLASDDQRRLSVGHERREPLGRLRLVQPRQGEAFGRAQDG